jgi:carbon storage regulator
MLVLTRKRMEQIVIGSGIRITVLKIERNQVRIGIEAPLETPIIRAELLREEPKQDANAPCEVSTASGHPW